MLYREVVTKLFRNLRTELKGFENFAYQVCFTKKAEM